jgi:hypothetical protein
MNAGIVSKDLVNAVCDEVDELFVSALVGIGGLVEDLVHDLVPQNVHQRFVRKPLRETNPLLGLAALAVVRSLTVDEGQRL